MLSRIVPRQAQRILSSTSAGVRSRQITHSSSSRRLVVLACLPKRTSVVSARSYATTPMAAETDVQADEVANSTGITPESMTSTLKEKLHASHVDIQDISGGCGASFAAVIVSDEFKGKSALQRHRLVNGVLKEEIKAIHAWTPRCLTEEQWEKEKQKSS